VDETVDEITSGFLKPELGHDSALSEPSARQGLGKVSAGDVMPGDTPVMYR
jgi:hypothetical protein